MLECARVWFLRIPFFLYILSQAFLFQTQGLMCSVCWWIPRAWLHFRTLPSFLDPCIQLFTEETRRWNRAAGRRESSPKCEAPKRPAGSKSQVGAVLGEVVLGLGVSGELRCQECEETTLTSLHSDPLKKEKVFSLTRNPSEGTWI